MLTVEGLKTSYGQSQVLFGVDLEVRRGEVVTLLGRNGMGKTTTIRSIMGMTPPHGGTDHVRRAGAARPDLVPHRQARARPGAGGTLHLSEPHRVGEPHRHLGARDRAAIRVGRPTRSSSCFPGSASADTRWARQLSGGEQQMLAIARALMTNPELLILDEATEGLAPIVRSEIWKVLRKLKHGGQSILIVDKNLKILARLADRHYVLERGRVRWSGDSRALGSEYEAIRRFVGL